MHFGGGFDQLAGFVDNLAVDFNAAGENECLRLGTRGGEAFIDEKLIETGFLGRRNG
jgi:hypothetical protein